MERDSGIARGELDLVAAGAWKDEAFLARRHLKDGVLIGHTFQSQESREVIASIAFNNGALK